MQTRDQSDSVRPIRCAQLLEGIALAALPIVAVSAQAPIVTANAVAASTLTVQCVPNGANSVLPGTNLDQGFSLHVATGGAFPLPAPPYYGVWNCSVSMGAQPLSFVGNRVRFTMHNGAAFSSVPVSSPGSADYSGLIDLVLSASGPITGVAHISSTTNWAFTNTSVDVGNDGALEYSATGTSGAVDVPVAFGPGSLVVRLNCSGNFYGNSFSGENDVTVEFIPSFETVAAGCPGSLPTANLTCLSTARLGQVMQVQVNNLPQSAAVYALGFSNTISSAGTLPLDLTRYGMPGCHLLVSVDSAQMLTVSGSTAVYSLPIPSVSGLLGLVFYQQALVPDPAAGNPAGAVMSDAAAAVIGT